MAELGMPLGGGVEPGKQVLTMRVKRRAGVAVIRPTPKIALPTASLVSLGLPELWGDC